MNVHYKNTRIKQYHKENRALRTETTINNSYDFAVGKRLSNLPKLRAIGFAANRKLLEVERLSHELRETLERHLQQLGVRGRRSIGARWREALGGEEEPSAAPRPYRR